MTKKPGLPMVDELTVEQIRQHPCSSLRHSEEPAGPPLPKPQKVKLNKKPGPASGKEPLTISVAEFEQMSGLSQLPKTARYCICLGFLLEALISELCTWLQLHNSDNWFQHRAICIEAKVFIDSSRAATNRSKAR
jgi:hypothetical protein